MATLWQFTYINGLKAEAIPVRVPFAAFQYAANQDVMYTKKG